MSREPIPTYCFALVVVRSADRYLLVHERKHGQLWYVPAGRVEPGETFAQAAVRETLEESGIAVALDGIVRIEHTPLGSEARMRVIFTGHPSDDRPPKSIADSESLEAKWVRLDELDDYPLRGGEVKQLFEYSGAIYPLELLTCERV